MSESRASRPPPSTSGSMKKISSLSKLGNRILRKNKSNGSNESADGSNGPTTSAPTESEQELSTILRQADLAPAVPRRGVSTGSPRNASPFASVSVKAVSSYDGDVEGYVSFKKGDLMQIIAPLNNDWTQVRLTNGTTGLAPRQYLTTVNSQHRPQSDSINTQEWYCHYPRREPADEMIWSNAHILPSGSFHVRVSQTLSVDSLVYSLTILNKTPDGDQLFRPVIALNDQGKYALEGDHNVSFFELGALLDYYKTTPICVKNQSTVLTFPVPRLLPEAVDTVYDSHRMEIRRDQLEFQDSLGGGNFSDVKLALWRGMIRVAVKIMKRDTMTADDFRTECRMLRSCNHPHIVRMYGFCINDPLHLVAEFMENGSLRGYLEKNSNTLTEQQLITWSEHIADGMSYLESRKIVHRDLAARNVLIDHQLHAKVADFGLARVLMENTTYQAKHGAKLPIKWTAPEAIRSAQYTSKSDVWSYGITLYEIFTRGWLPYGELDNKEVIAAITEENYRLPQPTRCPKQVYECMQNCWSPTPEKRPAFSFLAEFFKTIGKEDFETREENVRNSAQLFYHEPPLDDFSITSPELSSPSTTASEITPPPDTSQHNCRLLTDAEHEKLTRMAIYLNNLDVQLRRSSINGESITLVKTEHELFSDQYENLISELIKTGVPKFIIDQIYTM